MEPWSNTKEKKYDLIMILCTKVIIYALTEFNVSTFKLFSGH